MVFHGSLRDSKSPQVSRTLLSILAHLNNGIVWMVSTSLLISKSSYFFTKTLRIGPSVPITNNITFMFHRFFLVLWEGLSTYLSFILFKFYLSFILFKFSFFGPLFCWFPFFIVKDPVARSCRIHRLHLSREVRHPPNECSGYNTKQSDSEAPVMLELWGKP